MTAGYVKHTERQETSQPATRLPSVALQFAGHLRTGPLSDVFSRIGLDVLAVDLDPQGNLSDYF
ncbi:MAG: hypothetical protein LC790_08210, partial [Actinobacteria bacterium]|nr:hypothetical protein [Actinomycetota bacterium]MCA1698868.1 hypothetical protein [Actinomycetota bacterium]